MPVLPMFENDNGVGHEGADAAAQDFRAEVSPGDPVAMVLKAHLQMERALVRFVRARAGGDALLEPGRPGAHKPSGGRLIRIAEDLSNAETDSTGLMRGRWAALHEVQKVRNRMAHEASMDAETISGIARLLADSIATPDAVDATKDPNPHQLFWLACESIVQLLELDRPA